MKVSDKIAKNLKENKIDIVFGIIGSANSHLFDSINKIGIKIIPMHHEQAAVMAAGAYYRTTKKIAVALLTAGGGASNAFTGVLSCWADSIPVFVIFGQESSNYLEEYKDMRMYGIQGFDTEKVYGPISKGIYRLTNSGFFLKSKDKFNLDVFFDLAKGHRPGPIILEVPFDIQSKIING